MANGAPGAPRKYDLEKEAKELEEWSKLPDALSLYEFTNLKEYCAQDISRFANESKRFYEALKKAKERIGYNREKACSSETMNYGVWNRNARVYDKMLKEHEDQDADDDVKRKKAIAESQPIKYIVVPNDLAIGSDLSASSLPAINIKSPQ